MFIYTSTCHPVQLNMMKHNNQAVLKNQNKTPSIWRFTTSGMLCCISKHTVHNVSTALWCFETWELFVQRHRVISEYKLNLWKRHHDTPKLEQFQTPCNTPYEHSVPLTDKYKPNNSMKQSSSWEANSSSASQEIPHILLNPKVH